MQTLLWLLVRFSIATAQLALHALREPDQALRLKLTTQKIRQRKKSRALRNFLEVALLVVSSSEAAWTFLIQH